jgi:hypothetical protein
MGRIGRDTKVWDEKGLQFPPFSASCSSKLSVLTSLLEGQVTVQSRAPRSNRSAVRR